MDPQTLKMLVTEVEPECDVFEERWHEFFPRTP